MADLPRRRELAATVKEAAEEEGVTERRLRRWVGVSALIEVFNIACSEGRIPAFLVKGGFALECRFRSLARASRDVDIVLSTQKAALVDAAIEAMRIDWSGFTFRIKGAPEEREHSYKFEVNAFYLGADWSTFEVEVVFGDVTEPEMLEPHTIEKFGLGRPSNVPCMNAYEQIAQKLHAATDPSEDRPRDLLDIFVISSQLDLDVVTLRVAAERVFDSRATHAWPPPIQLREGWGPAMKELIDRNEFDFSVEDILDGVTTLVAKMLGVTKKMNYRYHFLVLSAQDHVPNVMESALVADEGYNVLQRMTEHEGWRLAQLIDYPGRDRSRAVLAVLEKPLQEAESA
jgi:hypothetical protein